MPNTDQKELLQDSVKVICVFSIARTGSNYLGSVLASVPELDLYWEVFNPKEAYGITPELSQLLNQRYAIDPESAPLAANDQRLTGWIRQHPAAVIRMLISYARQRNSRLVYLKIFNGDLLQQQNALHQIAQIPEVVPVVLRRRSADAFISTMKARMTGRYVAQDTTQLKPTLHLAQYQAWANPRRQWYSEVVQIMQSYAKTLHWVTYEQDIDMSVDACKAHWQKLLARWTGQESGLQPTQMNQATSTSSVQRQDSAPLEHRIQNWSELWEELAKAGLDNEFMGYLEATSKDAAATEKKTQQSALRKRTSPHQAKLPEKLRWRVAGPFDDSYSLARVNREFARALQQHGHEVALFSTDGRGDFPASPKFLQRNPDVAAMHKRAADMPATQCDILSRNLHPPRVQDMQAGINLLHTYAWEESGYPRNWADAFNQKLQGITVTSAHVKKVLIDHGVKVPIGVSGLGTDHWERINADPSMRLPKTKGFRFLHVSSCFPRKGVDALLAAYGRAFRACDDVSLIIKTTAHPYHQIDQDVQKIQAADPDFPHIVVLQTDYSDSQLKALFQFCQALVAPSRAEGFGLPLAEALLSGLPVITTAWSGQCDFCNDETSWLIDYHFVSAHSPFNLFDSVWAEPDIAHLSALMREVMQTPSAVRTQRASKARQYLLAQRRWSDVAEYCIHTARQWAETPVTPQLNIGWLSTWGGRCRIANDSEHWVSHLSPQVTVLAVDDHNTRCLTDHKVLPSWKLKDPASLQRLSRVIQQTGLNTLVIQYNSSWFEAQSFVRFLDDQLRADRVVVLIMQTIGPHQSLSGWVPVLARCHRLLVHSVADLNNLKQLGLIDNVTLFPRGIPHWQSSGAARTPQERVIASYGFCLPHKGLLQLVEAVALLRAKGLPIRLNMVNAENGSPQSTQTLAQIKQKIRSLKLERFISVHHDFLTDQQSLKLLNDAELVVLPHQHGTQSASHSVYHALASSRPVAVTPLAIFSDVEALVQRLPGLSVNAIASGIARLLERLAKDDPELKKQAEMMQSWRDVHHYADLANRLEGMLEALHRDSADSSDTQRLAVPADAVTQRSTSLSLPTDVRKQPLSEQIQVGDQRTSRQIRLPVTQLNRLKQLMTRLRPRQTAQSLIRFGPNSDGGYLLPDDLLGIAACYSPGVADQSGFELDCVKRDIPVFMADASVTQPASQQHHFHFIRKFIGALPTSDTLTLHDWVQQTSKTDQDLLLQMDIEGDEYEVLLATPSDVLNRFRIMVIEFHMLQTLLCEPFFRLAETTFNKLLQQHACVHIHPNNYSPSLQVGDIEIPDVMEFTFVRLDRMPYGAPTFAQQFPHPLDYPNSSASELVLPRCWWGD